MSTRLFPDEAALAGLCRRRHIRRLALAGSSPEGAGGPDSEVDLLVEFEEGRDPGLLGLGDIAAELSGLLGGRPVDLCTPEDWSRDFGGDAVRTAEVQYPA